MPLRKPQKFQLQYDDLVLGYGATYIYSIATNTLVRLQRHLLQLWEPKQRSGSPTYDNLITNYELRTTNCHNSYAHQSCTGYCNTKSK
jgi:hypothetical protein